MVAFDAYLNLQSAGIEGECTTEGFEKHIQALSFTHLIVQEPSGTVCDARGLAAGRCDVGDFVVVKKIDMASPKISKACCQGDTLPTVELKLTEATGEKSLWMKYTLSNAMITNVIPSGSKATGEPEEQVSFRCEKIDWEYTKPGAGSVATGYDMTKQKGS